MTEKRHEPDEINQRVMTATCELLVHYGYDKTTMDDIARKAQVARSTIYQRWGKKEDLFRALLWHEVRDYMHIWLDQVDADPAGGTIGGMFRNGMRALLQNPLLSALFGQRQSLSFIRAMLGNMDLSRMYNQRIQMSQAFLTQLKKAGVVRDDLDLAAGAYIVNCLQLGFLQMEELLDDTNTLTVQQKVNALADMVDRYLSPPGGGDSEAGKRILRQMSVQFFNMLESLSAQSNT